MNYNDLLKNRKELNKKMSNAIASGIKEDIDRIGSELTKNLKKMEKTPDNKKACDIMNGGGW